MHHKQVFQMRPQLIEMHYHHHVQKTSMPSDLTLSFLVWSNLVYLPPIPFNV
jgi:hypothetical protein